MQHYDFGVVGPSGSGKTTWLKRLTTGIFAAEAVPTQAEELHLFTVGTSSGPLTVRFHDYPGGAPPTPPLDGCLVLLTKETLGELAHWRQVVASALPGVPFAVAVGKRDLRASDLSGDDCAWLARCLAERPAAEVPFYQISAKSNYHHQKPVIALLRRLLRDARFHFQEEALPTPPKVRP